MTSGSDAEQRVAAPTHGHIVIRAEMRPAAELEHADNCPLCAKENRDPKTGAKRDA